MEPAIYEKSILLRDHNIVLLPEISDDVLHRCRVREAFFGVRRNFRELITASGNLASAADPEALYLLQ